MKGLKNQFWLWLLVCLWVLFQSGTPLKADEQLTLIYSSNLKAVVSPCG